MAQVIEMDHATKTGQSILDPTCGSGSLLIKAASLAPQAIAIYGQEKDVATAGLAKMNMILHREDTAVIRRGNSMAAPQSSGKTDWQTYDYVVANPPFSDKAWMNGFTPSNDKHDRVCRDNFQDVLRYALVGVGRQLLEGRGLFLDNIALRRIIVRIF